MSHIINIARGSTLSLLLHFLLVWFIVTSGFYLTLTGFSICLVVALSFVNIHVGYKSKGFGWFDGLLVGLISCGFFLMYIAQYEPMDQQANTYLITTYALVSLVTSFIGSLFRKKEEKPTKSRANRVDRRR